MFSIKFMPFYSCILTDINLKYRCRGPATDIKQIFFSTRKTEATGP